MASNIHTEKLAIFSANAETDEWQIREYMVQNWAKLTEGLKNSTILFMAGAHGLSNGKLSEATDSVEVLQTQFTKIVPKKYPKLIEDKNKRRIEFAFLNVTHFYKNEKSKQIDENKLECKILEINPGIVVIVICFSRTLDLKFLLEGKGIFSKLRIQRDLNLVSKGKVLTLNETQKKFINTLTKPINLTKKLIQIEGRVGSGKTLLGIQVIKMKLAYYIRHHDLSPEDAKNKLRVVIIIENGTGKVLVDQLWKELAEDLGKHCMVEIWSKNLSEPDTLYQILLERKTNLVLHNIVMIDECSRNFMSHYMVGNQYQPMVDQYESIPGTIDYIQCVRALDFNRYVQSDGHGHDFKDNEDIHVTREHVYCQLRMSERSSQQILTLAYYLEIHSSNRLLSSASKKSKESFLDVIPKWYQIREDFLYSDDHETFVEYANLHFAHLKDVMLIMHHEHGRVPIIENLCNNKKWIFCDRSQITGSEASVVIVYDFDDFDKEAFTRAKNQLIIVTTSRRTQLRLELQQIKSGIHNNENCEKYHLHLYHVKPPICTYIKDKDAISNLLNYCEISQSDLRHENYLQMINQLRYNLRSEQEANAELFGALKLLENHYVDKIESKE